MASGPDFALCGPFTGKNGQSASRWLKKLDWELRKHSGAGSIDPADFLQAVDLLLADDAAVWAETTPFITELLETPTPTVDMVNQFKALFSQRYPVKFLEVAPVHFDSEISDLHQQEEEALIAYYKRTAGLLSQVGGRDCSRPTLAVPNPPALSHLETAMLDTVMRTFTRGIHDPDIRRDALRGLVSADRSLLGVYTVAEESRRSKAEYARLQEEDAQAREFQFYKEVVHRNMPSVRIDSLRASFQANAPQWGYQSQPYAYQQQVPQQVQQPMAWPAQAPFHPAPAPYYPTPPLQQAWPTPAPAYTPPAPYRLPQPTQYQPQPAQHPAPAPSAAPQQHPPAPPRQGQRQAFLPAMSANPFINGTRTFVQGSGVLVCIRCGEEDHTSRNCTNYALSREEQCFLQTLILGDRDAPPQFPPAAAATGNPPARAPPSPLPPAVGVHSITYGTAGMGLASGDVRSTEVLLGEGSGPNKRAHIDESIPTPIPATSRPPAGAQTAHPMGFRPGMATSQDFVFQGLPTMPQPGEAGRPKKKGQERTGKAATIAPLVELIDEETGFVGKPISVRQLLKSQKIDMTWMDFCVWSPTVCN